MSNRRRLNWRFRVPDVLQSPVRVGGAMLKSGLWLELWNMRWGFLNELLPKHYLCTYSCSKSFKVMLCLLFLDKSKLPCWKMLKRSISYEESGRFSGTPPWTPLSGTKPITGIQSQDYWAGEMPDQEGRKRIIHWRKHNKHLHTSNMSQGLPLGLDFKGTWPRGLVYTTG